MSLAISHSLADIPLAGWEELHDRGPRASPFLSPRFLLPWHRALGRGCDVRVARWGSDGGADEGLLFLCRCGEGGWIFLGGEQVADYLDALVAPCRAEAFWREFLERGLPALGGGPLRLPGLVEGTPALSLLPSICRETGLSCTVEEMDRAPFVSLPGSFEEYLERLGTKERHELRRKMRRAAELLPGHAFRITRTPDELANDLPSFLGLLRKSHPAKESFMDESMATFFREVAEGFLASGRLRLEFLSAQGVDVASVFQFRTDGGLLLYNSGYDPSLRAANPGLVLLAHSIGRAIDEGFREYDFLRGTERYKYDLGGVDRVVYRLTVSA
ncbi:MAG: GNAT family N-acetyltransferase [Deltaproteobacteria bacterium]|nr:MAG: GNAT family N-acetyltransferase [Deltaproteobacteria bacterium]